MKSTQRKMLILGLIVLFLVEAVLLRLAQRGHHVSLISVNL
jgi:hypothetical protein